MKTLYVQDQFDDRGDLVFNAWAPIRKDSFLTYNHQDLHRYAQKHGLEIKWLLN